MPDKKYFLLISGIQCYRVSTDNRKRRQGIKKIGLSAAMLLLVLAHLITVSSCSPVPYPDQLALTALDTDNSAVSIEPYAKSAEVSFLPVFGASRYSVIYAKAGSGEEMSVNVNTSSDFDNGVFRKTLYALSAQTEYEIKVLADDEVLQGPGTFTTLSETDSPPEYAPTAYLVSRTEGSALIHVAYDSRYRYEAVLQDSSGMIRNIDVTGSDLEISSLAEDSAYTLTLRHGWAEGENTAISSYAVKISVPAYNDSYGKISVNESDGTFSVGNPDDTYAYYLIRRGESTPVGIIDNPSSFRMPDDKLTALSYDTYYIAAADENGQLAGISDFFAYLAPVTPSVISSDPQSLVIGWDEGNESSSVIYQISMTDASIAVPEVTRESGKAVLALANLQSKTEYTVTITAVLANGMKSTCTCTYKTDSFAGRYRWLCSDPGAKVSSFAVEVKDAEDVLQGKDSHFKYYIYVDSIDPSYTEAGMRVCPLIDESSGESAPSSFIPYSSTSQPYMRAYRWNESKWNTTSIKPSSWKPSSTNTEGDKVISYVDSKAFVGTVSTMTVFEFDVTDGAPVLVFTNQGYGSKAAFVNMGLFQNPDSPSSPYSFTLEKI